MPTYPYQCRNCGHELEEFQSMSEPPLVRCPNCHTDNLVRVLGTGTGLIFRGSGFYLTDYKKTGSSTSDSGRSSSAKESKGETKKEEGGKKESSEKKEDSGKKTTGTDPA